MPRPPLTLETLGYDRPAQLSKALRSLGSVRRTAVVLGVDYKSLRRLMSRLGIEPLGQSFRRKLLKVPTGVLFSTPVAKLAERYKITIKTVYLERRGRSDAPPTGGTVVPPVAPLTPNAPTPLQLFPPAPPLTDPPEAITLIDLIEPEPKETQDHAQDHAN